MKDIKTALIITFFTIITLAAHSQSLTFDKLIQFRGTTLANVEESLTVNDWYFHSSEAQTDSTLGCASFAFGRREYEGDKALAWLYYYYSSDTGRKRVAYQIHSPTQYNKLLVRSKQLGFKLIENSIANNSISKSYQKGATVALFRSTSNFEVEDGTTHTRYSVVIMSLNDYQRNFKETVN